LLTAMAKDRSSCAYNSPSCCAPSVIWEFSQTFCYVSSRRTSRFWVCPEKAARAATSGPPHGPRGGSPPRGPMRLRRQLRGGRGRRTGCSTAGGSAWSFRGRLAGLVALVCSLACSLGLRLLPGQKPANEMREPVDGNRLALVN
jgi:hypothetical protein